MHRTTLLFSLLTAALAIGCDGGSPEPGGDVVGTWRQATSPFDDPPEPIDERRVWTFRDDGTVSWGTPAWEEDTGSGTYETVDGRLIVTPDGDELGLDLPYYADDDHFLLGVLAPDDDGDDVVATWTGYGIFGDVRVESTATLRDNGSSQLVQQTPEGTETYVGTWEQRDEVIQVVFGNDDPNVTITMTAYHHAGFLGELYEPL
jgi:hypothetical protein